MTERNFTYSILMPKEWRFILKVQVIEKKKGRINRTTYFEEENINTLEIAGKVMLTVLSAMAQQESENISSHVKLGLQMKQREGER